MVLSAAPAYAQAPLSVPYLPQTEALCGGAAAAMVMRFWGARGVYATAFAPLVDKSAGGIHTSALNRALTSRGWRTEAGGGDLAWLSREVGQGRPVIALIEDRPGRYHYVVVVAASERGPVVVHDPARAPSRAMDVRAFDRKWQKADRWMLVALPGPGLDSVPGSEVNEPSPLADEVPRGTACSTRTAAAVSQAEAGNRTDARRELEAAASACPLDAAPWRELAGLDVIDRRWDAAAEKAREATSRDPTDAHAWRILATAEYLRQHDLAALDAWNRVGEPRVDLVDIRGLVQTRYRVVSDAIAAAPGDVLTADAVRLAQNRVREIPAVSAARVTFHPLEAGQAQVDVTIVERERAPLSYPSWLAVSAGALANGEARIALSNLSGGGDGAEVAWRWWQHRPKIAAAYAAPGPLGTWRLELSKETQTFGISRVEETRTRVGVSVANWLDPRLRVTTGVSMDRWQGFGRTTAFGGRAQFWPVLDHLAIDGGLETWVGAGDAFTVADVRGHWRSRATSSGTLVLGGGGLQVASARAPASLWPGADAGPARSVLLRAHPLLDDGIIEDGVFGRRILFSSVEAQRWLSPVAHGLVRVAPAIFVDAARATRGLPTTDERLHVDVGGGLRLSIAGGGVLRVDVARGLRDGRTALSIGWQR